jgi:hypothetical protein
VRIRPSAGTTSFRPFIGCIPSNGGGGRALTGVTTRAAGIKPSNALFSVVVNARIRSRSQTVRASCPTTARLVGATHAISFRQGTAPSDGQRAAIHVTRISSRGGVVARVSATAAAGTRAELQVRSVCASVR